MTDEQRVKEVYPDFTVTHCAHVWEIWESESVEGDYSHRLGHSAQSLNLAFADAASRLPKAEENTQELLSNPEEVKAVVDGLADVAARRTQTFEEWWNSDKQWEVARSLEGEDNCDECCGVYALAAWNAAKASSPAVAGGESETEK